ncbi:MAG: hypothetical protein H6841_10820 [Planctomycetes bacterium]|nr:hypothetical protein [Planctomycetota bacterium]MCB9936267.1 hypothetical protein [Planctomycetota bacterium]
MQKIPLNCPNCGATEGTPAPHSSRICAYCGTHYLLRPDLRAGPEPKAEDANTARQWVNLNISIVIVVIIITLITFLALKWARSLEREPETTSQPYYIPYNPRR